jgi:hypothetical protein
VYPGCVYRVCMYTLSQPGDARWSKRYSWKKKIGGSDFF